MAEYSFNTKINKKFAAMVAAKSFDKATRIVGTPFDIAYEKYIKNMSVVIDNYGFNAVSEQEKFKESFTKVYPNLCDIAPTFNIAASMIVFYIIKNIQYECNYIKLTEEDFVSYSGMSVRSFYEGLSCLLRPEVDHICAGDSLKLLAKTTKKSIYVVNHKMIYKGDINNLVTIINCNYKECELDSKGRVIIRN